MREHRRIRHVMAPALAGILLCACLSLYAGEGSAKYETVIAREADNVSLTVDGDVSLSADSDSAVGVSVKEDRGEAISVAVKGSVSVDAKTDSYDHQGADGLQIMSYGKGSKVSVTVGNGIRTNNTWTAGEKGNLDTSGFQLEVGEEGTADVTVNGGIQAKSHLYLPEENDYTWTAGISSYNLGGNAAVTVNGNIVTDDQYYGVALNAHTEAPGTAFSQYEINGDLTGNTLGIRASNYSPEASAEIIVNGTVSGEDCVSLEGDCRERIRLTFWRAQSKAGGNIIRRDEETGEASAEALEKKIGYILRVAPDSASMVKVNAEEYRGYSIAGEGEKVTLQVTAPEGYEVAAVYGMPDGKTELMKEAEGRYALEVPKGGGIEISVKLKKAQPPVPKTGDRAEPGLWILLALIGSAGVGATALAKGQH